MSIVKRFFLVAPLLFIFRPANAERTKLIPNPFTGKLDFVTKIDTNTITPGTGVTITCTNGVCTVNSTGGGSSVYPATATASFPFGVTGTTMSFTCINASASSASIVCSGGLVVTYGVTVGSLTVNGSGNGQITLTVSGSTYTVVFTSQTPTVGGGVIWTSTNGALGNGNGTGTPGGSTTQFQYNLSGAFAGTPYFIIQSTGITISTAVVHTLIQTIITSTGIYMTLGDSTTLSADATLSHDIVGMATNTVTGPYLVRVSTNGHIVTTGPSPTISACGTTPNGSVVGTDVSGTISVGGGVVTSCTLTFGTTYGVGCNMDCQISDNSTAVTADISALSATAFTASTSATLGGGIIYYTCHGTGASCR